jgi:hypothetical protein
LLTTVTELKLIAAAAMIGLSAESNADGNVGARSNINSGKRTCVISAYWRECFYHFRL